MSRLGVRKTCLSTIQNLGKKGNAQGNDKKNQGVLPISLAFCRVPVWSKNSCGLAGGVFQQAAQPFFLALDRGATLLDPTLFLEGIVMYGRPRICKDLLSTRAMPGCSHVSGLFARPCDRWP